MTIHTKTLFKQEIYEEMHRKVHGPSIYRGAEEAFEMFYADRKLQDFLRAYAIHEDIIECKEQRNMPGLLFNRPRFSQAGENRAILLIDDQGNQGFDFLDTFGVEKAGIYIGPRKDSDAALMIYTHLGEIIPLQSTGLAEGEVIRNDAWKIKVTTWFGSSHNTDFDGKCFPVSQAPLFQRISKQNFLNGLEKAIKIMLNKEIKNSKS